MLGHGHLFAVDLPRMRLIFPDRRRVFAVGNDDNWCAGKNSVEDLFAVDEHCSGRSTHEYFDAAGLVDLQLAKFLEVFVHRPEIESVIGTAATLCCGIFCGQRVASRRLRIDIRHVHETRDSACRSRPRFRRHIALVSETGLAKVDLVIDHAWQQIAAIRIHDFHRVCGSNIRVDTGDP